MITWRRFLTDTCTLAGLALVMIGIGYVLAPSLAVMVARHALPAGAQIVFRSASDLHVWGLVFAFALPPVAAWLVDLIDHLRGRDAPSVRRLGATGFAVIFTSAALIAISVMGLPGGDAYNGFTPMVSLGDIVNPSLVLWATVAVVPIAAYLFGGAKSPRPSAATARGSAGTEAAGSPASRD